ATRAPGVLARRPLAGVRGPATLAAQAETRRRGDRGRGSPSSRGRCAPALWRGGKVQLDRLAAGARARVDAELFVTRLEDQRRDLLGAVDADPGAEHPAARAVATRRVRCQSETLARHASRLAAGLAPGKRRL